MRDRSAGAEFAQVTTLSDRLRTTASTLRDMAIQQNRTRQRLIEYCNRPGIYQIEDAPGNMSHALTPIDMP
jgi:hypothetical protein